MRAGVPVVLASRCPSGAVGTAYAFPGGGATWVRAGAIPAGTLCAIKARVALALGLGAGLDHHGLTALLVDPLG
jgi:L-asparaginase